MWMLIADGLEWDWELWKYEYVLLKNGNGN